MLPNWADGGRGGGIGLTGLVQLGIGAGIAGLCEQALSWHGGCIPSIGDLGLAVWVLVLERSQVLGLQS